VKILLTGSSGFIGRNVLQLLSRNEIETVVIGRRSPNSQHATHFIPVDLLGEVDFDELVKTAGATHLLHLAWYAEHGMYWTSPLNLRWVDATIKLTEAFCRSGGHQVVIAGTCAEYGWADIKCDEANTPLLPSTLYGISKDATRRLVEGLCREYQVPYAWGRIFLPYGPGEDARRLIPGLIDVFRGRREAFGVNVNAYRDFLRVEDVASGFLTLLQGGANGAFNICSGHPILIGEVVELIARKYKASPQMVLDLSIKKPGEPIYLAGDNNKISALGWHPKHRHDEIDLDYPQ
jgi:nucleoside-diphosphate-sugar epimerase